MGGYTSTATWEMENRRRWRTGSPSECLWRRCRGGCDPRGHLRKARIHYDVPEQNGKTVQFGADASCYSGSVLLGAKRSIRHLIGVSSALQVLAAPA
jgi:hypothetical protein